MPRHNPRRTITAPLRLEDDDRYLSGSPTRNITKPTFPKLLAQSTLPYDPTLPPVPWNTRPGDQPFLQAQEPALHGGAPLAPRVHVSEIKQEDDFSEQLVFEDFRDLDMETSESEAEGSDAEGELHSRSHQVDPVNLLWSSLRPALQLSVYEYVYKFLYSKDKKHDVLRSIAKIEKRTARVEREAAELIGMSSQELIETEAQRAFRAREPMTEDRLREESWNYEEDTYLGENLLSKGLSRSGKNWQEVNRKYVAQMVHISKYTYATKREIEIAKAYLEKRGLKSKVAGDWIEDPEEYTMILVSTQPKDPKSPIVLPDSCLVRSSLVGQALPAAAISPEGPSGIQEDARAGNRQSAVISSDHSSGTRAREDARARSHPVTELELSEKSSLMEVETLEDFTRKHDPKIILPPLRPASQQPERRGHSLIRSSDLVLKVNPEGRAEIRKKRAPKRRADSELRPTYPDESEDGAVRLVIHQDGTVGPDHDTRPTPEVEILLQTGLNAGKRGFGTSLTDRSQDSRATPARQEVQSRRFSDRQWEMQDIGQDRRLAPISNVPRIEAAPGRRVSLILKLSPPRPDWSPIEKSTTSPIVSPSPSLTKPEPLREAKQISVNPETASLLIRGVESRQQMHRTETSKAMGYSPVPFGALTHALKTKGEKVSISADASGDADLASSTFPFSQDDMCLGYESGLQTSRGTSTWPELAKRQKPAQIAQQMGNHTAPKPKQVEKGARGGSESYNTKKKKATK